VPALHLLIQHHHVLGVVTQQPPAGAAAVTDVAIKQLALDAGIPVFQPEKISDLSQSKTQTVDAGVYGAAWAVAAGMLTSPAWLGQHPCFAASTLARRCANSAIRAGDTGRHHHAKMDVGLDTGPICASVPSIAPDETGQSAKLAALGGDLLINPSGCWRRD
jgi:methionyl-tRNA formyltransferase